MSEQQEQIVEPVAAPIEPVVETTASEDAPYYKGDIEQSIEPTVESEPAPEPVTPVVVETPTTPQVESPKTDAEKGLLAAHISERKKRQAAEARAAELEQQLRAGAVYQPTYQDVGAIDPQQQQLAEVTRTFENKLTVMSEMQARQSYPDYDEKLQIFAEAAKANPALWDQVNNSVHPANEAYQIAKSVSFYSKYGNDPDAIRKNIEKEVAERVAKETREKVLAELGVKAAAKANQPTNLSTVRTAASGAQTAEWKPTTVAQLFKR